MFKAQMVGSIGALERACVRGVCAQSEYPFPVPAFCLVYPWEWRATRSPL